MRNLLIIIALFTRSVFMFGQTWQVSMMSAMPEPVSNNAVAEGFYGDTAFVFSFGGIDTTKLYSGIHKRCFRYNTMTNIWQALPGLPDTMGKIASAASRVRDTIYIAGGYYVLANTNEVSSNKLHRFCISTNSFLPDGANIPVAIDDQVQCVWRDSLIFFITGWSNTTNINAVQIYNPFTNTWATGTSVPNNTTYKAFGASGTIIGDTIFYFGGARINSSFSAQNVLRKGIINPQNPTQITWSYAIPASNQYGYRAACTAVNENACWIGGSTVTYNYNGIAYNGSGGVAPQKRALWYNSGNATLTIDTLNQFPMDLRGIANVSGTVKYIAGGMDANQKVTNNLLRLEYDSSITLRIKNVKITPDIVLYPNPVTDYAYINSKILNEKAEIVINNSLGQIVFEEKIDSDYINLSKLLSGFYYYEIKVGSLYYKGKLAKE